MRYVLCCACLALLTGAPPHFAAEDKGAKLSAAEEKVVERVNQARKTANLPLLKPNAKLCGCARGHAALMAKKGQLKQSFDGKPPTEQLKAAGYEAGHCGSLVAAGSNDQEVFTALLNNKLCRRQILYRDATEVGVGIAPDGKGKLYYNIILAKPN